MDFVSDRFRLVYTYVPKVASTSIKHKFIELQTGEVFEFDEANEGQVHRRIREISDPLTLEKQKEYWTFAVVRDPATRILSAFSNRVIHHRAMHKIKRPRLTTLLNQVSLNPDINEFLRKIDRYRALSGEISNHTRSFRSVFGDDLGRFDKIYPIENLDALANDLGQHIGQPVTFPREQSGGPKITLAELDAPAFDALMEYTRDDYDLLSNYYSPPLRP